MKLELAAEVIGSNKGILSLMNLLTHPNILIQNEAAFSIGKFIHKNSECKNIGIKKYI